MRSLKQEANSYIRNAQSQSINAILTNQPTGSLTSATLQTYKQAVNTAYQAFNLSISNAKQTAISAGTQLDSSAVKSAVSTLQSDLTSAIQGLGTQFTSSTYNPTSTVTDPVVDPPGPVARHRRARAGQLHLGAAVLPGGLLGRIHEPIHGQPDGRHRDPEL